MGSVIDDIDLIKLAIFILKGEKIPIAEGTCVFERGYRFNRAAPYQYASGQEDIFFDWGRTQRNSLNWPNIELTRNDSDPLIEIVRLLEQQRNKEQDIKQAMWHFGRACIAPLPRDVLLESVIGLDKLLVPGGGDSRYRFALHGAAILSDKGNSDQELSDKGNSNQKLFHRLQELYDIRSPLAHGNTPSRKLDRDAEDARKYLAKAIFRVSQLSQQGIHSSEKSMAKSIEDLVLKSACKSIEQRF